jgi:hypothetical protein
MLPVLGVRVLDGRVGSTLFLNLLATSSEVAMERRHPAGERRYASWCVRAAAQMTEPWDDARHPGLTPWFFDEPPPVGPLPWTPQALDLEHLRVEAVRGLWSACSAALVAARPGAARVCEWLGVELDARGWPTERRWLSRSPPTRWRHPSADGGPTSPRVSPSRSGRRWARGWSRWGTAPERGCAARLAGCRRVT